MDMNYIVYLFILFSTIITTSQTLNINSSIYDFKLNPESKLCKFENNSKDHVRIFAYIHSSPSNFKKRLFIRETWTSRSHFSYIRVMFVMGISSDKKMDEQLLLESNIYKDVLMGNFNDTYRNLTHKCVLSLKWINQNCQNVDFIIKADDDAIFDLPSVSNYLTLLKKKKTKKSILCNGYNKTKIIRDPKKKWYVSKSELSGSFYLPYCVGFGLFMTFDLVDPMLNAISQTSFFWIDDYFLYGLVAYKVKATHLFQNTKFILFTKFLNKLLFNQKDVKKINYFAYHADKNLTLMFEIWNKLKIT
jgi:hypothetical protein